ncbi:MAG: metalloregulator ArsR/SmtB family transcription factor [Gemmatimonadetes bacterium]|nr:metalloregulator ArsR/SmtB family transcription factor [Gemmatimonadota bacterium]
MKRSSLFGRLAALSDPIRARLLAALERHELTVGELHRALQLPQSTVSRHLRALADAGWVMSREDGTSNRYRIAATERDASARKLWLAVREELGGLAAVQRDAERVRGVLAARHTTSQKFFASSVGQWDRLRAELFGDRTELFSLLGLLDAEWTVADLGCGTGQLAAALSPFVKRVIAIDESAAMLRGARARLSSCANVEVRQGSLESLPLADGEVNVAVLSLVLHYIAEPQHVLAAIRRSLVPGGRLLVLDMQAHDRADLRDRMGHAWQGFAEQQLRAWSAEAGYTAIRFSPTSPQPSAKGPGLFVATLISS